MSTSTITPLQMTGVSSMSSNLQQILNRAVSIAQIPLQQLQNKDSDALQEKTLLSGLSSAATALGTAVSNLSTVAAAGSLSASSSDPTTVSVQNTGATYATVHTISNVSSIATAATASSAQGYSDASKTRVSATGTMELVFGNGPNDTYPITLTNNTLAGLRDAINGLNAGVTADILSTGSGNYLTLTANGTGAVTDFSLIDDPGDSSHANTQVLSNIKKGTDAVFQFDGIPVDHKSNMVNDLVSGLTFSLLQQPASGASISLSLAPDGSRLSGAISSFVTAYNSMFDQAQQQVGSSAGLLSGDSAVRQIQSDLRALASSSLSSGSVRSLADAGLTFDDTGHLSFDTKVFNALSSTQLQDAMKFFSSEVSGGFAAVTKQLSALTDPVTGIIKVEQDGLDQTDKNLHSQISTLTDRVNAMQAALSQQLAAADTMIAGLESQQNMLNSSIAALDYAFYGKVVSGTTGQ